MRVQSMSNACNDATFLHAPDGAKNSEWGSNTHTPGRSSNLYESPSLTVPGKAPTCGWIHDPPIQTESKVGGKPKGVAKIVVEHQ
ncbi:hypothetical protein N7492_007023 [Penicillium capsulatum]|uniref:Uncharacterized protein n=1 Tax=Penicillium capsulatum TaxID=69766 RepID=A0A9W9I1I2_9EURO|nr:hypothetical protein N7492_007023 [Penicillium capsulatum]KAJ6116857.1 hypothetical protein N7512_006582 [Penicillium capsulatum]